MTTKNVIEPNLIGFPNFMFSPIGSYPSVFGLSYPSMGTIPIWPQMANPITNVVLTPKPILKVSQIGVVSNKRDLLDDDNTSSKKKHNPKLP